MCGSRLSGDGRVIVTTPAAALEVGHEFRVVAHAAAAGVRYADWVLRLCRPVPVNRFEAAIVRPAEESLKEALRKRELHPSLLERP
jgi:hypothetical protein